VLEISFKTLCEHLGLLQETLDELHRSVIEKPLTRDVVLVDLFSDAVDDLTGWLGEARAAATEGLNASVYPALDQVRRSLKMCQEKLMLIGDRLTTDLLSYERIAELTSLGCERGGEWMVWARNVKAALESCREPFFEVNQALFVCWLELTERIGTTSVSVQATNIGQQITVPGSELAREGVP
jgi:hypothetical protein